MSRRQRRTSQRLTAAILVLVTLQVAGPAHAQEPERCFFLCAPDVKIEPTITFEPVFRRRTLEAADGSEGGGQVRPDTEAVFETILAVGVPTTIPRIGFTFETIFVPFGDFI